MENYKGGFIKEKPFLMAELLVKSNGHGSNKIMPRIDLTPMVDLGFLLITFFMMTTSMAKPRAIDVQMPSSEHAQTPTAYYESSAITLIPASKNVFTIMKAFLIRLSLLKKHLMQRTSGKYLQQKRYL